MKKAIFILTFLSLSCGLQQNLSVSFRLNEGMTKNEVLAIMGNPAKSDFYKRVDEWFYCSTGDQADEHLALFFFEDKLVAKLNYTVTMADTRGAYGSCEKFIKMGNYRTPDKVIEIRARF